jgi:hypothetical protein
MRATNLITAVSALIGLTSAWNINAEADRHACQSRSYGKHATHGCDVKNILYVGLNSTYKTVQSAVLAIPNNTGRLSHHLLMNYSHFRRCVHNSHRAWELYRASECHPHWSALPPRPNRRSYVASRQRRQYYLGSHSGHRRQCLHKYIDRGSESECQSDGQRHYWLRSTGKYALWICGFQSVQSELYQ